MARPNCEYCGKPYGAKVTHTEMIFCPEDLADPTHVPMAPAYIGNGVVTKEWYSPDEAGWTNGDRSIEATRSQPNSPLAANPGVLKVIGHGIDPNRRQGRTLYRTITIPDNFHTPYEPFCKLRCALAFARSCHRAGYRIKKDPS
jgi:hypothetical protein